MKQLSTWDTYVQEVQDQDDRRIELPLSPDEVYIIDYPTRRRGRMIQKAQRENDTDALLMGLLGEEAGARVMELAEDAPADVLDNLLLDVMRKFGLIPDVPDAPEVAPGKPATNGRARKAPASRRKTPSKRSSVAST